MNTEPSLMIVGGHDRREPREFKVSEYAERERVTTRTVWLWISKGAVPVRRTPGGGVRIVVSD